MLGKVRAIDRHSVRGLFYFCTQRAQLETCDS